MQLHRLRLQAIGPFAGAHEIDFAALAAGGIFLLEGPTGAGKSTLIDAIVYALYGSVASDTTSKDRIRSGFANPDTESYVDLVFETSSGIFRVRRSPEWWRPKKRGDGVTKQQAGGGLWRLTSPDDLDGGEHVSGRLDEIGVEIERAVGLNRSQFVQTIVLPQGEFATFLKAKPEERRLVLQRVFGTEDYERVQEELVRARKAAHVRVGDAQQDVEQAVSTLCGVLGPFEDEQVPETMLAAAREGNGLEELVTEHLEVARARAAAARQECESASSALAEARKVADSARERREAAGRVLDLHGRRARLLAEQPAHEANIERLAAARRAAVVVGALTGTANARAAEQEARGALERLDVAADLRALDRGGLTKARDEAQRAVGSLADAVERAAQMAERERLRTAKRETLTGLESSVAALAQQIAERPEVRDRLTARRKAVQPVAEGLGKAELELEHARRRLTAASGVAGLAAELVEAKADVARLAAAAKKRVEEEGRLRRLRIDGIAGELARDLAAGEPCAVCGSVEHPDPAVLTPDHVDESQILAAEADREEAVRALDEAKATLTATQTRLAELTAQAEGLDLTAAETAHAAAESALAAARDAVEERDRIDDEIAAAAERDQELQHEHAELVNQIASLRSEIKALDAQLTDDAAALESARGKFETVELRLAHLESRCEAADALLAAQDALATATSQLTERMAELETVLAQQGFPDAAAAQEASLDEDQLATLEAAIAEHRDELNSITEALADPRLAAALGEPDPAAIDPGSLDLAALDAATEAAAAALESAEAVLRAATEEAAVAERRATDGTRCHEELGALLRATAKVRDEAAPVIRMADLANGAGPDNPRRLTLATYVLLRRFEEVVAVANERLAVMSDGRYALERSDERESGGGLRQGLALRVRDHTIDALRDPKTLSGGETFYVSLCLALALAQVVTAEAGGVDLGTLFVDEGFGTLDPHVLEAVLSQLGALHAEGRIVGIISHVAELKDTIAERIAVRPTPQGPSTLTVIA